MAQVGDPRPAAEQQSINVDHREGVARGGGGGGEEAQLQLWATLLIPVAFAMLVALPPPPVNSMLLFELHVASIFLVVLFIATPETAPNLLNKTTNMEMISGLRKWGTSIAGVSLLLVFVLRCCLQLPRPSLIRAGLFFIAMLLVAAVPPLLFTWSKYKVAAEEQPDPAVDCGEA